MTMVKAITATITLALFVAGVAVVTNTSTAVASGGDYRDHTHTLRFTDRAATDSNTDIDLGTPGPSAGDQQVFRGVLYAKGRPVGTSAGVSEVVALTRTTLTAQVVITATIPGGTLTLQMAFTETLADGPPSILHQAITGGTGRYRGARGECQTQPVAQTDDSSITCTLLATA